MKTKNVLAFIFILGMTLSCSSSKKSEAELDKIRQEVMDIDIAFSKYSEQNGFAKALAQYAADNVIKLNPRQYAAFGKAQLQKEAASDSIGSRDGALTWNPRKVHISESGDMAAAFGDWYYKFKSPRTSNDTTIYGNYVTVWEKQVDGSWKFILDSGNPTPGPTTEEMLELVK